MASSIPSFIFGAGTKYKTQEELQRAREQVKALLEDTTQYTGWGGVLENLGEGIAATLENRRIDEGQEFLTGKQGPFDQTLAEIARSQAGGGYGGGGGEDTLTGGAGEDTLTGKGQPSVDLSGDRGAFVAAMMPAAVEHGARIGVDPRIIVAQAAQETGWGKHAPNNNYFGIKSHGQGGGQTFATNEVINGKRVTVNDSFRKFNSPADSVAGYADFLASNKRYRPMREAQGLDAQLRALGRSGYATDPNYAASVGAIARSLPLSGGNQLSGGGGNDGIAGGAGTDDFLSNRRRMTPAMLEQEAGTEARPIWDNGYDLSGRRRMTPAMMGEPDAAPPEAPSPLDGRRRMTPAMLNPVVPPAPPPAPMPAPDPARFGPTPPVPVAAPLQAPNPDRFAPAAFAPPAPQIFTPPAAPTGNRLGNPPPSMAGTEAAPYPVPGNSMAGTETAPPQFAPTPARMPAPIARVDPFTDMILGDQASKFKPGNVSATPPAETARGLAAARNVTPFGANVFPAAPPAPGTPAAAGFGVPQQAMAGGGGSNTQAGGAGADRMQGGGDKIAKLMFVLSSPYASDEQKRMATAMLSREYDLQDEARKAASPEAQLDLQYKRAQIEEIERKRAGGAKPMTAEERKFWNIPDSDKRPYMLTEKGPELIGGAQAAGGGGVAKKSLTPVLMQRPDGSRYLAQPDEEGKILPSQVNEGDTPVDPTDKAYSTAYGRELGEVEGQRMAAAEQQIASAFDAKNILQQIRDNPYLERGTGASAWGNVIPGTGGYDFQNLVDQAKSGAFLTAIPQLKGFGALSNTEGAAATAAINRMDTATSKEAFIRALDDYEAVIKGGLARAQDMIRKGTLPPPTLRGGEAATPPPAGGSAGQVFDYVPGKGMVLRQ